MAQLTRNPSIGTVGLSGMDGNVFMCGDGAVSQMREEIKDMIDKFVNQYLAANP